MAKFCPLCGVTLEEWQRPIVMVHARRGNYSKSTRRYRVCRKCGVRVVLHRFPPGRTYGSSKERVARLEREGWTRIGKVDDSPR